MIFTTSRGEGDFIDGKLTGRGFYVDTYDTEPGTSRTEGEFGDVARQMAHRAGIDNAADHARRQGDKDPKPRLPLRRPAQTIISRH